MRLKGNYPRCKRARNKLLAHVRDVLGHTNKISVGTAVVIYTEFYNIDRGGKGTKEWLYDSDVINTIGTHGENKKTVKVDSKPLKTPKTDKEKQKPVAKETFVSTTKTYKKLAGVSFYMTKPWRNLRKKVLSYYGCSCMLCGYINTKNHVDHIYPRSKYPQLELDFCNLQVLCEKCNSDKSNTQIFDLRPDKAKKYKQELDIKIKKIQI